MQMTAPLPAVSDPADTLVQRYAAVRAASMRLAQPLSPEDAMLQSMADASPAKWHLAHTTWFFDHFVLQAAGLPALRPEWNHLLNSYYESAGSRHPRAQRGLLSRPSLDEVFDYRRQVDTRIVDALSSGHLDTRLRHRLLLGLHHEQQHQELLLTDIKHAFSCNALLPAYRTDLGFPSSMPVAMAWLRFDETLASVGHPAWPEHSRDFAYDNESPRHHVLVHAYALANRAVSNAEYRQFIEDGGYARATLWLSDGWATVQANGWSRPLYWQADLEQMFTLAGLRAIDPLAPVSHLSYYEADAFARWAGARLPTEAEWEHAATVLPTAPASSDGNILEPQPAQPADGLLQMSGEVWQWTSSAYTAYPGYRPWPGDVGEYNGKFMCGQWVLRGGSRATPPGHLRPSYRNFFPPAARWQFAGLRLARDEP